MIELHNIPSALKNPFTKNGLDTICIHFYKNKFANRWQFSASIEFVNESTEGRHRIKGKSPEDVFKQIETFLNSFSA